MVCWKIPNLVDFFHLEAFVFWGFPVAMFDYQEGSQGEFIPSTYPLLNIQKASKAIEHGPVIDMYSGCSH